MFCLAQELPGYVECGEKRYVIRTDFRIWMEFERLLFSSLDWKEKAVQMLTLCYQKELPDCLETALLLLFEFYVGKKNVLSNQAEHTKRKQRVYDFFEDAELFYAAFLAQYRIDLTEASLHWWKFLALFRSLSEDSKLMQVIRIRAIDLGRVRGSEKNYYRRMKWLYRLPQDEVEDAVQPALVLDGLI